MATNETLPVPYPESLCHQCGAPPRLVRSASSVFILCPVLPNKYPRQPVYACDAYAPRNADDAASDSPVEPKAE